MLEENLMNIEESEAHSVIYEALTYAEQAGQTINR